ncbi:hypothetical protein [Pseudidiomarina donghaiensis]|uniref:Serine protease n=1 Tax=Pseudidiomarina donghaiensis TaxID=519452 RepID=A0A432XKW7_9GAMM|nr:hypothetical protein [Pseudidiomarina donghaiensis]RUO49337.1 hypothetical protein CWE24_02190 [Pseudidiomarina donghaiensis]SFV21020.1 hypothetical protein SAMN04488139_0573 [Pseudidiomarina donghaiensis]
MSLSYFRRQAVALAVFTGVTAVSDVGGINTAYAQATDITQTFVEAGEIGQGFLLKRLDACYLITPEHVVNDAFFASVTAGNAQRSRGDATAIQTLGYDLAILGVTGNAQRQCGIDYASFVSATTDVLKSLKSATQLSVSTISADGARVLTPANIASVDLLRLYIQPTDANTPLMQGMSGSLVFAGNTPVGMLQSVDANTSQGVVLRIDRLLETINPFFNDGLSITSETPLTQLQQTLELTAWSHASPAQISAQFISDGDKTSHWRYRLQQGPQSIGEHNPLHAYRIANQVRLQFSLGASAEAPLQNISSITFSNYSDERDSFIRDFEILASRKAEGAGWVPVYAGTWMIGEKDKTVQLNNVAARRLMLVARSHWNPDATDIVISEVTITNNE